MAEYFIIARPVPKDWCLLPIVSFRASKKWTVSFHLETLGIRVLYIDDLLALEPASFPENRTGLNTYVSSVGALRILHVQRGQSCLTKLIALGPYLLLFRLSSLEVLC